MADDSHISRPDPHAQPPGPVKQHHRMAMGDKVNGTSNPNGAGPDTSNKIAGQTKQY
jgi:hypothetical protein